MSAGGWSTPNHSLSLNLNGSQLGLASHSVLRTVGCLPLQAHRPVAAAAGEGRCIVGGGAGWGGLNFLKKTIKKREYFL